MLAIMTSILCSVLVISINQKGAHGRPVPRIAYKVHKVYYGDLKSENRFMAFKVICSSLAKPVVVINALYFMV